MLFLSVCVIFICLCYFFVFLYFLYVLFFSINLRARVRFRRRASRFGEVRAHVALEVEVREFIRFLKFKKFREGRISVDFAAVFFVLKRVFADVRIDFAGDFSARHFRSGRFAEEGSEFITDKRRFYETTRLTVAFRAFAFAVKFLGCLEFTFRAFLERAELSRKGRELAADSREVSKKFAEFIT